MTARALLASLGALRVLFVGLIISGILGMTAAWADNGTALPPSNRISINLGETPWRFLKDSDPANAMDPAYNDTPSNPNPNEVWTSVGVPHSPSDNDTFLNLKSGGGQGQLTGNITWYRKHFSLDNAYKTRKIFVEFEGAHMGARVFINGHFIPGNSLVNPNATHVVGFVPFIVDITDYVKFDGADNVLAVKVARGDTFFTNPNFSGAFRFGQADSGLFRPVWMYITDRVHIPRNTYAVLNTWGTYVSTLSASDASATVRVQTNVANEYANAQTVTLNTQIVDAAGNVVASAQDTKTLASAPLPATPAQNAPETAPPPATFDQTLTVDHPTLWYPNNSQWGRPYMYTVVHTVSVDGVVVDATTTPLGIRTIAWDQNFPIINGHAHYLWGASGRYDYPALGSAVPEEQQWRDVALLANAGGSLYRPGHSAQGPEFLAAADAFGVMMVQPSGDGENGFAHLCPGDTYVGNCTASTLDIEMKKEVHRDMIVHDRNNPSVLAWEADNGVTDTGFARALKSLSETWDPVLTRAQSDRTPDAANGDILGCSGDGCDIGVKRDNPNVPAWGSEYWDNGVGRDLYDFELPFAALYMKQWVQSVAMKSFGMAHWYLADTPGEIVTQVDGPGSPTGSASGHTPESIRGNGASMMDANRIPRLLYYIYQAAWTPYDTRPVVKLAYHWNRMGQVRVNAFSNCPSVRLLLNGQRQGGDMTPNPLTSDVSPDMTQNTTLLPTQVHWDVMWAAGTLTAQCLDANARVVLDAAGNPIQDTQVTAGTPDHIRLTVTPELVRPSGQPFAVQANGTDAAFITAEVVDANNVRVPNVSPTLTFAVSGPGTYRGGADHYVNDSQPDGYHAPGDPNLTAEGGVTRIAVRAQFTPGTVTVTAAAPGLGAGTASFQTVPTTGPSLGANGNLSVPATPAGQLSIVTPPQDQTVTVGQTATFTVLSAGAAPLSYQWQRGGVAIPGATSYSYTTPATSLGDNGAAYSVIVANASGASVTSTAALLTVVPPTVPTVLTQPKGATVIAGQNASFSVQANGSPVLKYQWFKNKTAITGATGAIYNTPVLTLDDNGASYTVVITNTAGSVTSDAAVLTVGAATPPTILTPPASQAVPVNQTVVLSVLASGTAPLHYQWTHDGVAVGPDAANFVIPSVQTGDAGAYTVTVTNVAGTITSKPAATLSVSGSNGTNLAQGKTPLESSEQNGGLTAKYAFDGNATTRWSSAPQIDPSWVGVDLGSLQTFDEVVLVWENAYATEYQIQVSNDEGDNKTWTTVYPADGSMAVGHGGTETLAFPSTTARFVRMLGNKRATDYGYSLFEFQVYDVPQCGTATERYTLQPARSGTYVSPIAGIPNGPFVPTVVDNVSGLTWQQYVTTFTQAGAQFTRPVAEQYCASVGMRVPTQDEALTIAGNNYSACAFPNPWTTWTETDVAGETDRSYFVSSAGQSSSQITDNSPGWALCVVGKPLAAPTITAQPANQTAPLGGTATFTVGVGGPGPFSYQWLENGAPIGITTVPTFTTAPLQATDDGASFNVIVSNGGGSASSAVATLTLNGTAGDGNGNTGNGGNGNTGGNTGGGGNNGGGNNGGGNADPLAPPTKSPASDLAAGKKATATSDQGDGYPASAAVDGDLNSRWSSGFSDTESITVDLGAVQTVDRVVLRWEAAYGVGYLIEVSTDNKSWKTVHTETQGKGGVDDIRFDATQAQFVRMSGTKRSSQYGYSLFEFEVYNTATTPQYALTATAGANGTILPGTVSVLAGATQTFTFQPANGFAATGVTADGQSVGQVASYTFTNIQATHTVAATFSVSSAAVDLALHQPATSSELENAGYPAGNAVDGDPNTRWSSAVGPTAWLQVDLGAPKAFNRVVLSWENAYAVGYQVQVSNVGGADDQNWTTVHPETNGKGGIEDITFTEVTAQYVRLKLTQRSGPYGYSLWSFQVYDMPTPPALTAQPANVTVTAGQTAQFTVAATGTAPFTYQWYVNGTLAATTDSPLFTTESLTTADSGTTVSVVVGNVAGTVASASATVTVTAPPQTGTGSGTGDTGNGNTGTGGTPPVSTNANLALGVTMTASGTENDGYPAGNAADGSANSRFSSNFDDQAWLQADLGAVRAVNRVVLRWENAYGVGYLIQTSTDGKTWDTAFTQTNGKGGDEDLSFATVNARYVRLQGVKRSSGYGYSLFEFEVYNTASTPRFTVTATAGDNGAITPAGATQVLQGADPHYTFTAADGFVVTKVAVDGQDIGPQAGYTFANVLGPHSLAVTFGPASAGVDLAAGKAATASGTENDGYPAGNAVDGNPNTRWSSAFVDPSWIAIDLGSPQTFNRVVLNWENAHGIAYLIQVSNVGGTDDKDWTTVYTQAAGKGGVEDLSFTSVTARYVRLLGTQRSSPYGYSLFSFQVFNNQTDQAPAITSQPQNQTVRLGQSASFSVTVSGTGPFTYQWQRNGTDIAGATSASYSTPATTSADNNAQYTVVVTGPQGTKVTSTPAILTVNASGLPYTVFPGFVGVDLQNNTHGTYSDDQVYVAVIGRDPATGQFAWLKPDGTLTAASAADNDGAGHLTKNGQNYSNYFFTLAQAKQLKLPKMDSGRVFIALGEPLYIKILMDANNQVGYAGPNPLNGTDPNINVYYDWYEFTYNASGLWINTTQVDQFGLPLLVDVYGANNTFHKQTGINQSRAALYDAYIAETPAAFHSAPLSPYRIMAPYNGTFDVGQANATYFDGYVDQIWAFYATNTLTIDMWGGARRFVGQVQGGQVQGGQMVFSEVDLKNGAYVGGSYIVNKPTTQDVLRGAGALHTGNDTELALEAQLCAAFNRHIMDNAGAWATPSVWYSAAPANFYAKFWHDHSVGGLAYGFAYDDVSDQSSTITTDTPEHAVFGIGW
ncbi:immunoglobulin I-set domain protein [Nitrospirillum viridazoti]|uniref:Glycoside hydrolase family 2 n=2 Tax=Nitrospirillum TaxID=1543705 RepID=A0A248K2R6_9PROT|nr:glycoside hydrolase family 2 [Nitrospirillum amazonense CBAmc]TWB35294.1 immunoglobulin I-set domain protein [Nitrospirillum amazonense]